MLKATLTAITSKWIINLTACVLLAMLFAAEINIYYTIYFNDYVVQERLRTNLSDNCYTFLLSDTINKDVVDEILKTVSKEVPFEDVVIGHKIPDDDDGNSREIMCFYDGISILHDFRSDMSHEKFNDKTFDKGNVLVTNNIMLSDEYELNGEKYKLIQQVTSIGTYGQSMIPLFCSSDIYFKISDGVDNISFEFRKPLNVLDFNKIKSSVASHARIYKEIRPSTSAEKAIETIGINYQSIVLVFIIMIVVTTCVIPIIRYCLWLRRYEFRSYRVCGADASYITFCEVSHVAILGIMAVILGCIFSIQTLFTEGFWIMLLITIALFILRLLAEILISGKNNENIVEVNERWR